MNLYSHLIALFLLTIVFTSCQKEDGETQRTTNLVTLYNNTGVTGCSAAKLSVNFIVSYRDIQVDVSVDGQRSAIINVLVEDGESINVRVQNSSDDTLLADTDVVVRTESRTAELESEFRSISYCTAFNLTFNNF